MYQTRRRLIRETTTLTLGGLLRVWPARFVRQHGPLRPVVERVLREFLKCGLLEHGFARL
jgi:hypothetical protein